MQLLERDSSLDVLGSALDRVSRGTGSIALVSGEAGIGKTSLIRQFAASRGSAVCVLWGGCEALFAPHPLAPLHDIARQIGGDFPAAIASAANRHDIFNAALDRLARLPAPAVMVIEDVHWADEATLDFVKFLGRRLQRLGVLLVVSYRDDEVSDRHPLRSVVGDLTAGSVSRIRLSSLSRAAVEMLAQGAGRTSDGLYEMTCGNPFFVTEVLAAPKGELPSTVRDAVMARLSRLSDAAREVARLASIVPGKVECWLVDRVIGASVEAVQECLAAGMIILPDRSLGFRHELARRAVEDSIPLMERQQLHARALAALLSRGEQNARLARLVYHADQAADSAAVLRFAPCAAERAAAVGAHREAAGHLGTALRHGTQLADLERAALLERLSYECYLTDQVPEAVAAREAALALWRAMGSRRREGDALRWLSRLSWFSGRKAAAEARAMEAVAILESLSPGRELAMAYSNRAQLHMLANETAAALDWGCRALDLARALGEAEIEVHALTNIGTARLVGGDPAGRADLERALRMALDDGFEEHAARAYANLSSSSVVHRDVPCAARYLGAGIAYCEDHDLDSWARYMTAYRAELSLASGRWDDAARDAQAVIGHPAVAPVTKIPALVTLARLRLRRGDPDSETPLSEAHGLALPTRELQRIGPVLAALAERAWLRADSAPEMLEGLSELCGMGLERSDPWIQGELAFWLWRHGRLTAAPPTAARPFALQIAGDWQAAARAWEELGCPYEQAMALADAEAEGPLRAALALCEGLGAAPLAAILRRKLRASGIRRIPRGAREGTRRNPCGMTARQLKVLALLAEGHRNAEIARRLFLSEKTVGHHVSAVLAKLEVRSRTEAAAAAAKLGLSGSQIGAAIGKK